MNKYGEKIKSKIDDLAKDENVLFIGYNLLFGSKGYGLLADVPPAQIIESPVAENLMMGMAIGLAIDGRKPVVCFERHDFLLNALDAIVNHLDALWGNPVLIRATVGSNVPLDPGPQHVGNYHHQISEMVSFPCYNLTEINEIDEVYKDNVFSTPMMVTEYRELY